MYAGVFRFSSALVFEVFHHNPIFTFNQLHYCIFPITHVLSSDTFLFSLILSLSQYVLLSSVCLEFARWQSVLKNKELLSRMDLCFYDVSSVCVSPALFSNQCPLMSLFLSRFSTNHLYHPPNPLTDMYIYIYFFSFLFHRSIPHCSCCLDSCYRCCLCKRKRTITKP
jgi:hypothetical protein